MLSASITSSLSAALVRYAAATKSSVAEVVDYAARQVAQHAQKETILVTGRADRGRASSVAQAKREQIEFWRSWILNMGFPRMSRRSHRKTDWRRNSLTKPVLREYWWNLRMPSVSGLKGRAKKSAVAAAAAQGKKTREAYFASAGKLASVFKSAEAVRKWTDAFHNISAGLGRDVNELVENFVKSKASGRFEAGFLDMFAAKGVDIWAPVRAARPDKTAAELRKMAVEGKIAFSEIEAAILSTVSAGGAFAGMAEKISATSGGAWDTLVAKAQIAIAKLAEPINAASS